MCLSSDICSCHVYTNIVTVCNQFFGRLFTKWFIMMCYCHFCFLILFFIFIRFLSSECKIGYYGCSCGSCDSVIDIVVVNGQSTTYNTKNRTNDNEISDTDIHTRQCDSGVKTKSGTDQWSLSTLWTLIWSEGVRSTCGMVQREDTIDIQSRCDSSTTFGQRTFTSTNKIQSAKFKVSNAIRHRQSATLSRQCRRLQPQTKLKKTFSFPFVSFMHAVARNVKRIVKSIPVWVNRWIIYPTMAAAIWTSGQLLIHMNANANTASCHCRWHRPWPANGNNSLRHHKIKIHHE